jgi:hypothetical protein
MDDEVPGLLNAIEMINGAIALAETAKTNVPSEDQTRKLEANLLRLNAELAVFNAELDAALKDGTSVQGPSAAQVAQIDNLLNRVEQASNQQATVDGAISLTGQVLDLATAVVSNH